MAALGLVALALIVGGGLLWRLDRAVVERFQNRRFAVPSAVYSSPTELRPGQNVGRDTVIGLLAALDYIPTQHATPRTGQYRAMPNALLITTHDFRWPGGSLQDSRTVRLEFADERLATIRDKSDGRALDALALDPLLLGKYYDAERETRELVAFQEVESRFVPALIAAEDNRFYSHPGIDMRGLLRAAWVNLVAGGIRQGGSTITQQLVKNLWLTPARTLRRKFAELFMALALERHYTKAEILETYANVVYFGQRGSVSLIGVSEASRYYFGKRPLDLTWAEAATLAGLIRSPARYNPFDAPETARQRRGAVLNAMRDLGFIDQAEAEAAKAESLQIVPPAPVNRRAAYFVDYVGRTLRHNHRAEELRSAGLRVYTTLAAPLQLAAESAVNRGLRYLEATDKRLEGSRLQAALVAMDPANGRILAYVGGRDYAESQFDRADQAQRQIGSLVKPFIYYAAIQRGYAATSTWSNERLTIATPQGPWEPQNYDTETSPEVTLRAALERSLNIPTVRIATAVGLPAVKETLEAAGIRSPVKAYPALALGALEASPLEMARAYSTLAALGMRSEPVALSLVSNSDGGVLSRVASRSEAALDPAAAYVVDQLLVGVIERGTGRAAQRLGYAGHLAGKTGTTSDYRDAWFVGYTPQLVTVVWVGTDDNSPVHLPASKLALPIWGEFMLNALLWYEPAEFGQPEGVIWSEIDPASGERATHRCPDQRREVFLEGTEPRFACRHHQDLIETILNLFR